MLNRYCPSCQTRRTKLAAKGYFYLRCKKCKFFTKITQAQYESFKTTSGMILQGPTSANKTGYKGVSYHKKTGRYVACVCFKGKNIHLGYYVEAKEAARAYNEAARAFFGPECYQNPEL